MNEQHFLSCEDIQESLYLAPSSIRVCCKRFFVNGVRKGDVELLTISDPSNDLSPRKIHERKLNLIKTINSSKENVCSGCPYLRKSDWGLPKIVPSHVSLEYHSICNLKCEYCSDVYYGGESANYDVYKILKDMVTSNSIDQLKSVVWGGGEPFLDPKKDKIFDVLEVLLDSNSKVNLRVFSNAIRYEERFKFIFDKYEVYLTTSIDAGTESTYKSVRGKNKLHTVLENLVKYSENKPQNITVKYIFTKSNSTQLEVSEFVRLIQHYGLMQCNFQISIDFNLDLISIENFQSCVSLYSELRKLGVHSVYLDDLVWLRLRKFYHRNKIKLEVQFKELEQKNMLASNLTNEEIMIWGAGGIGLDIMRNSIFMKQNKIAAFVDSRFKEIDNHLFNGIPVLPPSYLKSNQSYVIIAAAQNYPSILRDFDKLELNRNRIITSLVL